jgi:hypothetical protein
VASVGTRHRQITEQFRCLDEQGRVTVAAGFVPECSCQPCLACTRRPRNIMPMVRRPPRIQYRWHPLFGQELKLQRVARFPRGEYVFCELPDGTIAGLPAWMTDATVCGSIKVGMAMVSAEALAELRGVLRAAQERILRWSGRWWIWREPNCGYLPGSQKQEGSGLSALWRTAAALAAPAVPHSEHL